MCEKLHVCVSVTEIFNSRGTILEKNRFCYRFLRQHPQHKLLHKDMAHYDDDDKMFDSTAFENSAVAVYNTFDEAMEKMDGDTNAAIAIFQNAGKMHAGLSNFQATYFKVYP